MSWFEMKVAHTWSTWLDGYSDLSALKPVQEAIDRCATQPVDWEKMLAHTCEEPLFYRFFYISEAAAFDAILAEFYGREAGADCLGFLPINLTQPYIDIGKHWRFFTARHVHPNPMIKTDLVKRYEVEREIPGKQSQEAQLAYFEYAFKSVAQAVWRYGVPASIEYG